MRGVGALTFDSGMEDGQEHGGSGSGLRRGARTGSGVIISGLCSGGKQHDRKQCQAGSDGGGGSRHDPPDHGVAHRLQAGAEKWEGRPCCQDLAAGFLHFSFGPLDAGHIR